MSYTCLVQQRWILWGMTTVSCTQTPRREALYLTDKVRDCSGDENMTAEVKSTRKEAGGQRFNMCDHELFQPSARAR